MEEKNKHILLIDADSLIYFVAHLETLDEAILKLNERIVNILNENNTNKYIMFLTPPNCFRYNIAKSKPYKGNRANKESPKWLKAIREYMKTEYKAVEYKGLESDDCVTYFVNKIANSRICAIDKDILNTTEGTHFNYGMKKIDGTEPQEWEFKGLITVSKEEAIYGENIQMLMGDPGTDNIPGIEGMGIKGAEKYLFNYESELGNTNAHILEAYIDKYGHSEGICRFAETFRLVYMLRNDQDMMREIGSIPEIPEIQEYIVEQESKNEDSLDW